MDGDDVESLSDEVGSWVSKDGVARSDDDGVVSGVEVFVVDDFEEFLVCAVWS